jgi:Putative MetA-pathway of phenol degradation
MRLVVVAAFLAACLPVGIAAAQQRPLVTEDPETIGGGRILIETGVETARDIFLPGSGLTGNLLKAPTLGVSIGLSSIAELQIDGAFYQRLHITGRQPAPLAFKLNFDGDSTSDVDDLTIATKLKIVSEHVHRPSIGLRLATKLPNASNETGMGLDTLDFSATVLAAKTRGSTRVVGNVGLAILGDPIRGDRQFDVMIYGVSVAQALREGLEVVGEVHGHFQWAWDFPPPGAESRATFRGGVRYTHGAGRIDAGLLIGTTSRDPGFGITVGYTHVLDAFTPP